MSVLVEGVRLIKERFLKIARCLLTINVQRLLCTVIKSHVVKEAKELSKLYCTLCKTFR